MTKALLKVGETFSLGLTTVWLEPAHIRHLESASDAMRLVSIDLHIGCLQRISDVQYAGMQIKAVAADAEHTLAVLENGGLFSWALEGP